MKFYIAGPMRGYEHFNFPAFDRAASHLRVMGYRVVSPAEHDREQGFDETAESLDGFDLRAALAWDMEQLLACDGVMLLEGWEQSAGATAEKAVADAAGIPCYEFAIEPTGGGLVIKRWSYKSLTLVPEQAVPASPEQGETRITNETTGGEKGSKLARFDLLPSGPLNQVAEHYGRGASKYADRNWEKGYDWSLSFAALQRHAWAFWGREDTDPETGSHHMAAVVFHAFALMEFGRTHPDLDNRAR